MLIPLERRSVGASCRPLVLRRNANRQEIGARKIITVLKHRRLKYIISRTLGAMARGVSTTTLRLVFARNVRLVRVAADMSQESLAGECELDRTFIGSLERGERNVSIDNVERVAKALRIDPRDLLNPRLAIERGFNTDKLRATRR
jgi:ribosome-binding protein aMBF1 (putative translation factor)